MVLPLTSTLYMGCFCISVYAGCFCHNSLVRVEDKCVTPLECPDSICLLPSDIGDGK